MVTDLGSHLRRLVLHRLLAREAKRILCVVGRIMYQWSNLRMTLRVILGTFPVNSVPATVLFDSRVSHSFIRRENIVCEYTLIQ
jgi:hypothetical protein